MKVDEERSMIEARCKAEMDNLKKELNAKVGKTGAPFLGYKVSHNSRPSAVGIHE